MRGRGPSILLQPRDDARRILRISDPAAGAHEYIYVDILGVLSADKADAQAKLDGIIRTLESYGLMVHGTEVSSGKMQTLGVELDCERLVTRVVKARRSSLRIVIRAFSVQPRAAILRAATTGCLALVPSRADMAQLVEQRIRNAWVGCSSHPIGTISLQSDRLQMTKC